MRGLEHGLTRDALDNGFLDRRGGLVSGEAVSQLLDVGDGFLVADQKSDGGALDDDEGLPWLADRKIARLARSRARPLT